jgi:hypothetical protein
MLSTLQSVIKVATVLALVFVSSTALSTPEVSALKPVWEKINGEWKFKKDNKESYESLVYVITTTKNNSMKNILTKDMVKLPFVLIIEEDKKEEISLH